MERNAVSMDTDSRYSESVSSLYREQSHTGPADFPRCAQWRSKHRAKPVLSSDRRSTVWASNEDIIHPKRSGWL